MIHILKKFSFPAELNNAKLVVCDNPQTAFIDALRSGPTILVINKKNQWRPKNLLKIYYKRIRKKTKLYFTLMIKLLSI